jgi:nitroimidazol reductase NimA-like FMN-containing flavoprotein (pyridoxamine 5'-phosphate oxidase superfamily)
MPLSPYAPTVLSDARCRTLLRSVDVGRILISMDALPIAFPVNYRLVDDDTIVFRTSQGTKLSRALEGRLVGFEIDQVDSAQASGWSVLVLGISSVVSDPAELAVLRALDLRSLSREELPYFVKIAIHRLSGRQVGPETSC